VASRRRGRGGDRPGRQASQATSLPRHATSLTSGPDGRALEATASKKSTAQRRKASGGVAGIFGRLTGRRSSGGGMEADGAPGARGGGGGGGASFSASSHAALSTRLRSGDRILYDGVGSLRFGDNSVPVALFHDVIARQVQCKHRYFQAGVRSLPGAASVYYASGPSLTVERSSRLDTAKKDKKITGFPDMIHT